MKNINFRFPNMRKLVKLHNDARSNNSWMWSINNLNINEELMRYSQDYVELIAKKQRLKHSKLSDIKLIGFKYVGENIAYGQKDEKSVMKTWLWSPGHRKNIMNTSFTDIGCGFAYSDNYTPYWCVCLGG